MRRRGGEEPLSYKNTLRWFELAVVFGLTSIGEILLENFEEGRPKRQRVVTVLAGGALGVFVSAPAGRGWFFVLLGVVAVAVVVIHA